MSEEISVVEGNPNDIDLTGVINQEEKDDFIIEDTFNENGVPKDETKESFAGAFEKSDLESDKVDWEKQRKLNLAKNCKKIKIRRYKKSFPNLFKEYNLDDIDTWSLTQLEQVEEDMAFTVGMHSTDFIPSIVESTARIIEILPYMHGYRDNLLNDEVGKMKLERLSIHYSDRFYLSPLNDFLTHSARVAMETFARNRLVLQNEVSQCLEDKKIDAETLKKYEDL